MLSTISRTGAKNAQIFGLQCQRLSTICASRLPRGVQNKACLSRVKGFNGSTSVGMKSMGLGEESAGRRGYKTVQEQRSRYKSGVGNLFLFFWMGGWDFRKGVHGGGRLFLLENNDASMEFFSERVIQEE